MSGANHEPPAGAPASEGLHTASAAGSTGGAHTAQRIEQLLREQLQPTLLEVRDDSAAHAGHASAGGKGHFRVRIVSTSFVGLSALQRHRRIHAVLAALWEQELHALVLEALTPDEVKSR